MIREIFMPALSSTMTEGKIVSWTKAPGDKVDKGETVVVVESDKADMDVESFYEGFIATIITPEGGVAPVGSTIALLAETEAEIETAKQQAATAAAPAPQAAPAAAPAALETAPQNGQTQAAQTTGDRLIASPRARKLAKDLKVDLTTLKGSGPHGRIVAEDVEAAAGKVSAAPTVTAAPIVPIAPAAISAPAPMPAAAPNAPIGQVVPFTTLQQAVTRNMMMSLQVPVFRVGYTITTDALDKLYKQVKSKGVTMTALLAKAVAMTLQKHPVVNAAYTDAGIAYPTGINVSVAVAMPDGGLITPVLKNADRMDIYSLSRTWQDLVERARSKHLQPDEYNSGTFTLSNLGMFGVDRFDAILPPGQGSILAIGASRPTVFANKDGMMGVRQQMQVNLTCDHRIIYGADAASFLKDLAASIENNAQSLTM